MAKIRPQSLNNPAAYRNKRPKNQAEIQPEEGVFSLVTYNMKNFFDAQGQDPKKGSTEKPIWEVNALTKVLIRSGAEVVTAQEVENESVLQRWPEQLPNITAPATNDKRGINLGVLSKYPMLQVITHKEVNLEGDRHFSRDLLRVDLDVQGETVSVYTTHSYSQRRDEMAKEADLQRLAEANAIKQIVTREMQEFPNRLYIITGDFNDTTEAPALQALLHGPGDKLMDTLTGQEPKKRVTWPADPEKAGKFPPGQFDHILIPEKFKHRLIDSQVLDYREMTQNASDHKPIRARFRLQS
ncbi:MAG: hypothetical protein KF760_31270 [Candidatus Eremiobacteraeota bacterium]|nr:hypothetical protein [Candidatus Eremiobacteraeota bacterium]MCW5871569.1 hypothetical protein [Candidatus Eremiobacteraeota bacterium]